MTQIMAQRIVVLSASGTTFIIPLTFTLLQLPPYSLVYTCDKHKHKVTYASAFHSLVLVLMLASLRRTCKPERRKHKHKPKHKALMLASHRFTRRFLVLMLMLASHRFTRRFLVLMLVLMLMLSSYV